MSEQEKLEKQKARTRRFMITITSLFILVMLVIPLICVIVNSLHDGIAFYLKSITTEYVKSALLVTLIATVVAVLVNTFFAI